MHIAAQKGEIMGDVASDTSGRAVNTARTGGFLWIMDIRHPTDIHVNRPKNNTVFLFCQDVAFPFNRTFAHQIHNVCSNTRPTDL